LQDHCELMESCRSKCQSVQSVNSIKRGRKCSNWYLKQLGIFLNLY